MTILVIGDTNLARKVIASLRAQRQQVIHLTAPSDEELGNVLHTGVTAAAVLIRNDLVALRYALATAHLCDTIPMVVTIFDRTVSEQLNTLLPQCSVTSPADLSAPLLAGPCVSSDVLAQHARGDSVDTVFRRGTRLERVTIHAPRRSRWVVRWTHFTGLARSPDRGTRILFAGLAGLIGVLIADWTWLAVVENHSVVGALTEAVRVVTTVGPATDGHGTYAVAASVAMLATIIFTALFTAGVVDRLLVPRLTALVGPRVLPRSGHVIVVGLGQVGLRLCRELVALGVDVVGVERDPAAPNLRLMRELNIPVVIEHGGDRAVLTRLRADRALAVAAVGSNDLDNIAVAIATAAVAPGVRLVLRAGEHEAIAETRSLLPLGIVRDIAGISAAYVVAQLLGQMPVGVYADGTDIYLENACGEFELSSAIPSEPAQEHPGTQEVATRSRERRRN